MNKKIKVNTEQLFCLVYASRSCVNEELFSHFSKQMDLKKAKIWLQLRNGDILRNNIIIWVALHLY